MYRLQHIHRGIATYCYALVTPSLASTKDRPRPTLSEPEVESFIYLTGLFIHLSYLWATYSDSYGYFGRAYFLVFLGCLWGLAGLYALRRGNPGTQANEKPSDENLIIGMTFVGLATALVGSILDYWGGAPGEDFTQVQITGFGLEMTGLLLVLLGSFLLGLHYRRTKVVPALVAWLLIAAGPGGILLSIVHIPSGAMLLFCCAWMVLGYLLLTGRLLPA